jgi:hypothetical protein
VKAGVLLIFLSAAAQLFASDDQRITVNNYTKESGEFVIHAVSGGKNIDLLCNEDSPYCKPLKSGEYRMVDWTVPGLTYQGPYTCREVDLFTVTKDGDKGHKLGEYCLVESREQ